KMVRIRGHAENNKPLVGEVATTQNLDEILDVLHDTRNWIVVLEQQVMENEDEDNIVNGNEPPPENNINVENPGGENKNNVANNYAINAKNNVANVN
ncbi:hypothetical protein KI387_006977, partial [Taxus chinensis]